jgi:hypothetical protein
MRDKKEIQEGRKIGHDERKRERLDDEKGADYADLH